ncbi:PAAR domain-containing protein [Pseudomonas sp. TH08]|nr:PAAR domain-containing protein [Pseudomonas sp. TH06]MBK5531008.1 PAAR domain-containing protein [Pseudomonas sp. TH08]
MARPAARKSDTYSCHLSRHSTRPIAAGSSDVFLDGLPAARQGHAQLMGTLGILITLW